METTTDTEDIGRKADALRIEKGVTVQALAAETKIPLTTLQRRLTGDGKITVPELFRISSALQVTPSSWFEEEA
jgi:transcriptional regulator with XRE-family HTH domain